MTASGSYKCIGVVRSGEERRFDKRMCDKVRRLGTPRTRRSICNLGRRSQEFGERG